ncbi:hypothetical protein CXB51_001673 [Gossypium anomalum]|uniref:RNase H type-1 domain-containing protein n=1 Tax=Gossypium anomalum TaxID=47600 RepID=A0A8J5ZJZ8_9ROSI|nr:hypothetical protein CXB51_001673 [Gossypium anomalum]
MDKIHNQNEEITRVSIQFDAAFDNRNSKSTSGLVVRDQMGEFTASKTIIHNNISSPFAAEAYVGLQAIKLGISIGLISVTIMGDSKTVIKKCRMTKPEKSVIGAIIRDIQSKRSCFQEIVFQFIHRSENIHAHKLAKEALEKGKESYLVREALNHNEFAPKGKWSRSPD